MIFLAFIKDKQVYIGKSKKHALIALQEAINTHRLTITDISNGLITTDISDISVFVQVWHNNQLLASIKYFSCFAIEKELKKLETISYSGERVDVTKMHVDSASERAFCLLEKWNENTGNFIEDTMAYFELKCLIKDAVHCGIQKALGIKKPLESEEED
jgi:hypothetical protein